MIIVSPGHIVGDQVPAVAQLILGGLGEGQAERGGDGAERGDGGTMRVADLGGMLVGEVGDELRAVVLDLEGERGDRHREGHCSERERRGRASRSEGGY